LEAATKSRSPYFRFSGASRALREWRLTAAPPTSLTGTFRARAAAEIRSASAMTSATGTLVPVTAT
jgi:hypothetical protein